MVSNPLILPRALEKAFEDSKTAKPGSGVAKAHKPVAKAKPNAKPESVKPPKGGARQDKSQETESKEIETTAAPKSSVEDVFTDRADALRGDSEAEIMKSGKGFTALVGDGGTLT